MAGERGLSRRNEVKAELALIHFQRQSAKTRGRKVTRIHIAVRDTFVFPRKFFAWRSGAGVSPVRFNQGGTFRNLRARRPCHYYGCGLPRTMPFTRLSISLRHTVMDSEGHDYPPQHFLYFFPLPHGHGSLRPIFGGAM
jgi:hypothetical protein